MHYVILRDDDTNALTPVGCLERLYRPLLDQGLPVNLAMIPEVTPKATMGNGSPEGFLLNSAPATAEPIPIGSNPKLIGYLLTNRGYHIAQHGLHHEYLEFDKMPAPESGSRLDRGTKLLREAGFPRPETFVAPYDRLSRAALCEVVARFRVFSTGWFELRRLPPRCWPNYALKKLRHTWHWQVGHTLLLSHPGCLFSYAKTRNQMLQTILDQVTSRQLTVLVTHWWEYFYNGTVNDPFIDFFHETTRYLAGRHDVKFVSFTQLANGEVPMN